jgi:spore germination cell wall hydrolase CwlJ-like protein|tara:strand:+ start:706 stop:1278 length:573 start_codon:yes stop_codon:yes gene_type:complete
MRFKTFVKVTTVTWCCAFIGGFLTGKSAFGDIFNGKPPHNHIECMAKNIYHEAKSQSLAGQMAVGLVVLNRVKSKNFPDDVCKVVYEGPIRESWKTRKDPSLPKEKRKYYPIRHRCQFSWYCDGFRDDIKEPTVYSKILTVASKIMGGIYDFTDGATHYHATYVSPEWTNLEVVMTIDDHIFYKPKSSKK